jgi:hypothetical protein
MSFRSLLHPPGPPVWRTIPVRQPTRVVLKICCPAGTTWPHGSQPVDRTPLLSNKNRRLNLKYNLNYDQKNLFFCLFTLKCIVRISVGHKTSFCIGNRKALYFSIAHEMCMHESIAMTGSNDPCGCTSNKTWSFEKKVKLRNICSESDFRF